MSKSEGVDSYTRLQVLTRAFFACERCGSVQEPMSVHHRTPRGMGGSRKKEINQPQNLLLLCGTGTSGCHGWIESYREQAYLDGYLVKRGFKPEEIPVVTPKESRFVIKEDGTKEWLENV